MHKSEPNIVQLRATKRDVVGSFSSRHQHLAVRQQRRRVTPAFDAEDASGTPRPAGRVVQFRAVKIDDAAMSRRYQHLAVGQQRRRVLFAFGDEAASGTPSPVGRVVQFRAG